MTKSIDIPRESTSSRISSRSSRCTTTSNAVVGSSAKRSFGAPASANAIMTLWRIPPESWCAYAAIRFSGAVIPTVCRRSNARPRSSVRFAAIAFAPETGPSRKSGCR